MAGPLEVNCHSDYSARVFQPWSKIGKKLMKPTLQWGFYRKNPVTYWLCCPRPQPKCILPPLSWTPVWFSMSQWPAPHSLNTPLPKLYGDWETNLSQLQTSSISHKGCAPSMSSESYSGLYPLRYSFSSFVCSSTERCFSQLCFKSFLTRVISQSISFQAIYSVIYSLMLVDTNACT